MKITRKTIVLMVIVAFALFINNGKYIEAASDGANMTKVLQYYAQKKYKKASKYEKNLVKLQKSLVRPRCLIR